MKVSVIIPAWNAEHTIAICIKSLIRQSHGNPEIIVVDDGSTDCTGEIVQSMKAVDKRIQYHR
ncbi:MAG TPA: glycosyltransferase [Saprospiraceae bacterium]|nr:glycosyltransferase [Saprospiraceae bacterium]